MKLRLIHRNCLACAPLVLMCCASASLVLLGGCRSQEKEKEPIATVQVTLAERSSISQVITSEAVVFPLEQATISPKITAPITEFAVQRGTHVKKGQLLARLENKDLAGQALASQGSFEQADAGYKTSVDATIPQQVQKAEFDAAAAKAAYTAQQKVYDSRKELFDQGAIPRRDLDSAEVALIQARAQSEEAERQLADLQRLGKEQALKSAHGSRLSAEGTMRNAEAQLSYSEIRSPIDGVVTDRPLYVGDLATANQPILTVMNTSRLIAKAHIAQTEASSLKAGDPAEIKVPGIDAPINARVSLVSPALDPGSTTIEVWVEAVKPGQLRPGMNVEISATAKTVKNAVVVPAAAVFKNPDGGDFVLVAGSDKKAHLKTVEVGVRSGELAQIASGVSAGDPIITTGGYALPDGTQIEAEAPSSSEKDAADKDGKDTKDDGKKEATGNKADKAGRKSAPSKPAGKEKE